MEHTYQNRVLVAETITKVGESCTIAGWVHRIRDHGKVCFLDIRDRSGILQVVTGTWQPEIYAQARTLTEESVVLITGKVAARPEKLVNPDIVTGSVELQIEQISTESLANLLPFRPSESTEEISEDLRLQHRYLDLRTERLQQIIRGRAKLMQYIRKALDDQGFTEVETPLLTASTPEGARDYIVPTRKKGQVFALPQSPQQFKQLLMAGGIEQYYQFAKCMRDEDGRGDRQPEFTQLDMELSFVDQETILQLNETLLIELVAELYPEKTIQTVPFPRISYADAMRDYGTDRPDIRTDKTDSNLLAFCWVVDFPFFEKNETGGWTFTHNPFSAAQPQHAEDLQNQVNIKNILAAQYDIVLNGFEIGGGSIRNHDPERIASVFSIMGYGPETIQRDFGHMIEAFSYGTPPHGGIAWGFDRLVMLLHNQPNIREVMAFPKNGEGRDVLMNAPSAVDVTQLHELGLTHIPEKQ
jgi:aspartyl-tRNA synthetase